MVTIGVHCTSGSEVSPASGRIDGKAVLRSSKKTTRLASGTINFSGVPDNADIIAAYLYWQELESSDQPSGANAWFRGFPTVGKQLAPSTEPSCWSSGGGNGTTNGTSHLRVYRSSVR